MAFKNPMTHLHKKNFRILFRSFHHYGPSSSRAQFAEPNIPLRKKRSSTDILKAIAGTIHADPTGPTYKYYDDPYLYPISSNEKKKYALSKESGRKAARFIRDSHGEYFNHQPDDPIIKDFLPKLKLDENSEVSEKDILNAVQSFEVSEATDLYRLCQKSEKDIDPSIKQELLELVSYYNSENCINTDWVEELQSQITSRLKKSKTWKDGGLAEELFEGLKELGSKPYCAIIRGMCNYGQVDRAWQIYQEAMEKEFSLDTETFNAIIRICPNLKEDDILRWNLIEEIFQKMIDLKAPPNLGTLNSVLEAVSKMRNWGQAKGLSLQIMSEFKELNIEPSLATYYHLLKIYYTLRSQNNQLLPSILNEIDGKSFEVKDLQDTQFFSEAMLICNRDLQSFETAVRLNNLLNTGENYKLLGDNVSVSSYYRNYFSLAANSVSLEDFLELYDSMVPHLYSPDKEVMEEIIKIFGVHDDLTQLPRIWSDCVLLQMWRGEKLLEMTLMIINNHPLEDVDSILANQLVNITWDIWTRIQNQPEDTRNRVQWSGSMLGDCISILVRCKDVRKATQILHKVDETPDLTIGQISIESLSNILKATLENHQFSDSLMVLKYVKYNNYPEINKMVDLMKNDPALPQDIRSKLDSFFD